MRLRVLVAPTGTPRLVTREPFVVLENGVAGARWTVGDPSPGVPVNEARAALLGVLQARVGGPAEQVRRVLVRLPRRLSGPRIHGGRRGQPTVVAREWWGSAGGWAEAICWLRGLLPTPPERPTSERIARAAELVHVELVPACWELSYPGAGLGLPKPLPRRRRRWQTIARSGDIAGRRLDMVVYDDLLPGPLSNSEAVAREIGQVVAAAGGKAPDVRVEGDQVHFTATIERPLDEAPELPRLGPNDPNPRGVDPTPEPIPLASVEPGSGLHPIAVLDFRAQTFGFIGGEPEQVLSAELNVDHDDGFDPAEMLYNSTYIRATAVLVGSDHLATLATGASRCAAAPHLSVIHPDGRSSTWFITDVTVEQRPHRNSARVYIELLGQHGQ